MYCCIFVLRYIVARYIVTPLNKGSRECTNQILVPTFLEVVVLVYENFKSLCIYNMLACQENNVTIENIIMVQQHFIFR